MSTPAITVEGLSKPYRIGGVRERYGTLRESLMRAVKAPFRRLQRGGKPLPAAETIWALKDVSFEVREGEVIGIIGSNGAGKSTLLKILSRITEPTEGYAALRGRVASLLEVSTGFHPELTGRENIYLSGAIRGMGKAEIDRKFDEIVDFSGVEKFLDTPLKRYSSGMGVRLGFAVAAHLEPEILLVDEVLAVGDAEFQKRCLGKMGEAAKGGRTVLFVSHNMGAINRLCQRALWLDQGGLRIDAPAEHVVSRYLTSGAKADGEHVWDGGIANPGVDELRIRTVRIRNNNGEVTGVLDVRKFFSVDVEYEVFKYLPYCRVGIVLTTVEGTTVFDAYDADNEDYAGPRKPGLFISRCKIPGNLLSPGRFILSINAGIWRVKNLASLHNVLSFDIEDIGAVGSHVGGKRMGIIRPKLEWWKEAIEE